MCFQSNEDKQKVQQDVILHNFESKTYELTAYFSIITKMIYKVAMRLKNCLPNCSVGYNCIPARLNHY